MRLMFRRMFLNEHGQTNLVSVEYANGMVDLRLEGQSSNFKCIMTLREAYEVEKALMAVRQKNEAISRTDLIGQVLSDARALKEALEE